MIIFISGQKNKLSLHLYYFKEEINNNLNTIKGGIFNLSINNVYSTLSRWS